MQAQLERNGIAPTIELPAPATNEVNDTTAPVIPPNGTVALTSTGETALPSAPEPATNKSVEEMTSLERMEHFKALADAELLNAKTDLADDLKKVIGAIKLLNTHGQNGVLADPLFEEAATFLKLQLNPHPENAGQGESGEQSQSRRVDAVVRRLLLVNAPMTESEIIKALPHFDEDRIRKTLKNRSAGKTPGFKCENNK
jgi:hypothetical protein